MSSSLLFQAVELAQAGRRDEARPLLWQYLQADPNNEVAWLWLASVAIDQAEYQRALNEVLRIAPNHQQAQQLLAQFRQQYGGPQTFTPPPAVMPSYTPPPAATPSYMPPSAPPPPYVAQGAPRPVQGIPVGPMMQPVDVQVRTVEKRRGCLGCSLPGCSGCLGCGGCSLPGCLLILVVLLVVPAAICGGLAYSGESLGPFDQIAVFLPGELGRKTITFDAYEQDSVYEVSLEVPRSWYVADSDNSYWAAWRKFLEDAMPFENPDELWSDFEVGVNQTPLIVETDFVTLTEGGYPIVLSLQQISSGDYSCSAVEANAAGGADVVRYSDNLCGFRQESLGPIPTEGLLNPVSATNQLRTITFYVPVDQRSAAQWTLAVPDDVYTRFETDIDVLIESAEINEQ